MNEDYIEAEIKKVEERDYSGAMPAHNKALLRKQLLAEQRYVENEERETSHSPVGDMNNMGEY